MWMENYLRGSRCFQESARAVYTALDWIMNRTAHRGYLGPTVDDEALTDLNFVSNVSFLASMLCCKIVVVALEILPVESLQLGSKSNCRTATNIQAFDDDISHSSRVPVLFSFTMMRL